jgi:hypothetical protein
MEAIYFSETSIGFQRITRHYIPKDITLHNHRCDNLKSYIKYFKVKLTPNYSKNADFVRFEVFTAVTLKNAVFWDVAPCKFCVKRRLEGTYRLHLQGRKIRERGTSVSRWLQSAVLTTTRSYTSSWRSVYLSRRKTLPLTAFV